MFQRLNNLKIWQKLILVSSLLALPIAVLLYLFVSSKETQIVHTQRELEGLEYVAGLLPLLEELPKHRDTALAIVYGEEALRPRLANHEKALEAAFAKADDLNGRYGDSLGLSADWKLLRADWRQLQSKALTLPAQEGFNGHNIVFKKISDLLRVAGEKSNLRTDQGLDTFYLADTFLSQGPAIAENLIQMRVFATSLANQGKGSPEEIARTLYFMRLVENANLAVQRNLAFVLVDDKSQATVSEGGEAAKSGPVSYTHLTLPTNREV